MRFGLLKIFLCVAAALLFGGFGASAMSQLAHHGVQSISYEASSKASIDAGKEQIMEAGATHTQSSHCDDATHTSDQCSGANCCSSAADNNASGWSDFSYSATRLVLADISLAIGGSPFSLLRPPRAIA
jgi:hypothetical protein